MKKRKGLLLVFLTAVVSGFSIFLNKFGVKGIDSGIFTFSKNILAALFIGSLIFAIKGADEFRALEKKDWLKLSAIGFVGGSIPFLLFFRGLQLTSSASASLIHKTMFLYVLVFAVVFLKEHVQKKVIIAISFLLAGNYLMLRPSWSFSYGDLLILIATLLWAAENTLSKYTLRNLSGNMVAFGRMFFGSLFIFSYLVIKGRASLILSLSKNQAVWILITTGMLFLYLVTWYNGLKHVDVSLAAAILLIGSPITTLLKVAYGGALAPEKAFGILLLLIGVITFMQSSDYFGYKEIFRWKALD